MLTLVLIGRVFQDGAVTRARVQGAVAAYLLIGLVWANFYRLCYLLLPGSFQIAAPAPGQPFQPIDSQLTYFSYVTLTTLGYGDIVPIHPTPRMLAILEALVGQLFPATLLARLVSLQISERKR
jgi:hypothetical protein